MGLALEIEKQIQTVLLGGVFPNNFDLEDICNTVLKRVRPAFASLRSPKTAPYSPAPNQRPDAYVLLEDLHKWIYFEYTHISDKSTLRRYVSNIPERSYYKQKAERIEEVVFVSSQVLRPDEKDDFRGMIGTPLRCKCSVHDVTDLVSWFSGLAPDLVEPLLGIDCHPKWCLPLAEAVALLNYASIGFPALEAFENDDVTVDERHEKSILEHFRSENGPCLVSGRWGTGKTVFALYVGFLLKKEEAFTVYYLDLKELLMKDDRSIHSAILKSALPRFCHPQVLFIIDNAHQLPDLSYKIGRWAIENNAKILLVSRPVSREMCDENQYFFGLFRVYRPDSPVREDISAEAETSSDAANPPQESLYPMFEFHSNVNTVRSIIRHHTQRLNLTWDYSEVELAALGRRINYNLTLLVLLLKHWNPATGPITTCELAPIYGSLRKRFVLDEFPEVYWLAALNHFDCPADLDVFFQDPSRKAIFVSHNALRGLVHVRRNCGFGINTAEARLILEAGIANLDVFLRDEDGRVFGSVQDAANALICRYACAKPKNPYELLRYIRWAAFEAKEFVGSNEEEWISEILSDILSAPTFAAYLREIVLPSRLSMLDMGNIARICKYVRLARNSFSNVITKDVIKTGVDRRKAYLIKRYPDKEYWFSWREYFAWRHLENLDSELGSYFLSQFEYSTLCSHGAWSLKGLANLLYMAAGVEPLKNHVLKSLPQILGDNRTFEDKLLRTSEIQINFLIRGAALLSEESRDSLTAIMPAKLLADVVKNKAERHVTGRVFYSVSKFMEREYARQFINLFPTDYVYSKTYKRGLTQIQFPLTNQLFQQFLRTDFEATLAVATLRDVQLFLRNLCLHAFGHIHRMEVAFELGKGSIKSNLLSKIRQEDTQLLDIAYFLLNLGSFECEDVASYVNEIFEIDLTRRIYDARLSDMALFFLSIWLSGPYDPLKIVDAENVRKKILKDSASVPVAHLVEIGGIISLLELDILSARDFGGKDQALVRYLAGIEALVQEGAEYIRLHTKAYRLALSLEGVKYFVGKERTSLILQHLAKPLIAETLDAVMQAIAGRYETAMGKALGQLPVNVTRKLQLLRNARSLVDD